MSEWDLFLTSLQDRLLELLMQTPKLGIYKSCSAPSHAFLYTLILMAIVISFVGVVVYEKYVVKR